MSEIIAFERIENKIYTIRNQKVMLDRDLAELYGVETKVLNQGVKRNLKRFPEDFMLLPSAFCTFVQEFSYPKILFDNIQVAV